VINIDRQRPIGPLLRELRHTAGLAPLQLAALVHISRSGIFKREAARDIPTSALMSTAYALGFHVVLVASHHPGTQPTGTGWPA